MNSILKKISDKRQEGFTIIEVMIVLAIAGVIIAAVLVAVPQLQRNQRNSARRAILQRAKVEIDNYIGNNNGVPPTATTNATNGFEGTGVGTAATGGGFYVRYIGGNNTSFMDPNGVMTTFAGYNAGATSPVIPVNRTPAGLIYRAGFTCRGEVLTGTGTIRNYAVAIGLEGGAVYCLDNR